MSYNPYKSAFIALTNEEAREFYATTAIDHARKAVFVLVMWAIAAYNLGVQFRGYHDATLVPNFRQWWFRRTAKRLSSAPEFPCSMQSAEIVAEVEVPAPWDGEVEKVIDLEVISVQAGSSIVNFLPPAPPAPVEEVAPAATLVEAPRKSRAPKEKSATATTKPAAKTRRGSRGK